MKSKLLNIFALTALFAALSLPAQLYVATGSSTGVISTFDFSVDPVLNRVTVAIDNTQASPGGVTGTLLSFGFNVPTDAMAASGTLLSQNWTTLAPGHAVPASWTVAHPYVLSGVNGSYERNFGAFGGSNGNGGNPGQGILFGETAIFLFQFEDFASASSFLGQEGISARWQQVTAEPGSDKGSGELVVGLTPVPEPSTYSMGAMATLALGLFFRRRRAGAATSARPVSG